MWLLDVVSCRGACRDAKDCHAYVDMLEELHLVSAVTSMLDVCFACVMFVTGGGPSLRPPHTPGHHVLSPSVFAQDHSRKDIAWKLGFDTDVLSEDVRLCEVRNWVKHQALPYYFTKGDK